MVSSRSVNEPFLDFRVCQNLGDQGPCPEGYWFVLDKKLASDGQPKGSIYQDYIRMRLQSDSNACLIYVLCSLGICKKWDCGKVNEYKMADTGECVKEGATFSGCPDGMEVLINPYGEGKINHTLVIQRY